MNNRLARTAIALCIISAVGISQIPAAQARPVNQGPRKSKYVPGEYILKFRMDMDTTQTATFASRSGGKVRQKLLSPRTWLLKFNQSEARFKLIRRLKSQPNVAYVEPNGYMKASDLGDSHSPAPLFTPNDPLFPRQWNFPQIGTRSARNLFQGQGAVVAVVDTGVAYENYSDGSNTFRLIPDLAQTSFVPGFNFINNTTHANDDNRHGTHVAGTVAQSTNNARGVTGIAFRTSIMPVKVLDSAGFGTFADVANGIRWAADHGADVINLSLGSSSPSSAVRDAVNYARNNKNVVLVAAAGNSGTDELDYPAAYPAVISVAATNVNKTLAYYSQFGDGLDISAPGGDVTTDADHNGKRDGILQQTIYENDPTRANYFYFQGTSMATPHVAGVAALVRSRGGNFTKAGAIIRAVLGSATDLGAPGYDTRYGNGLVNADRATRWHRMVAPLITFPTSGGILTGGSLTTITWNKRRANGLRYHLAYTSNAGAVGLFSDDFESGTISNSFVQGGNADWFATSATSAGGTYSARSGDIEDDQTSELTLTQVFSSAATGSFSYRVSSEANFDFLDFYVDGSRILHVSGESGWTAASFSVTAGEHVLKWIYSKDNSLSSGLDAAFIDNISLPNVSQADWRPITRATATNASSFPWRVPATPGNDYRLRIRGFNGAYGDWSYSGVFSVD